MTWYAHHVFAPPAALAPLRAAFPGHVFHVRDLAAYRTKRREVFAVMVPSTTDPGGPVEREVTEGPELPEEGLVVVREMAAPGSHAAEWFEEDALSWEHAGPTDPAVLSPAGVMGPADEGIDNEVAPPLPFLSLLRKISRDTHAVISFCCVFTWGGDLEYAFSWVFDGVWGTDLVYRRTEPRRVRAWNAAFPEEPRTIVDGDVLTLTLAHHGLLLADNGIFELHKRAFPWEKHKVG